MKKNREMILARIRKNAERGAGMAGERGLFEAQVPERLRTGEEITRLLR